MTGTAVTLVFKMGRAVRHLRSAIYRGDAIEAFLCLSVLQDYVNAMRRDLRADQHR